MLGTGSASLSRLGCRLFDPTNALVLINNSLQIRTTQPTRHLAVTQVLEALIL